MESRKNRNVIYPGDGTALIELNLGFHAIVDEADVDLLKSVACWRVSQNKNSNTIYVRGDKRNTCGNNFSVYMHRVILNVDSNFIVDHINGNGLDNRRANLRQCTVSENMWNSRVPKTNKSGFKGVSWMSRHNKWRSAIRFKGKAFTIGYFDTVEAAAKAVAAARIKLHGEFANHGQHTNQHLVKSRSVPTTYSPPMQENMCDQGE